MSHFNISSLFFVVALFLISCSDNSDNVKRLPYPEEIKANIGRGLVLFNQDNSNYLSWRMLPNEIPKYSIWRKLTSESKDSAKNIGTTNKTFFIDENVLQNQSYSYSIMNDKNLAEQEFRKNENNHVLFNGYDALAFDLNEPYKQVQVVCGDLNGNGEVEVVIVHADLKAVDPYEKGWVKSTDKMKVSVFSIQGEQLWSMDLGWGIEAGYYYAPIVVWDLDADGKCEIILKTNKSDDPLNYETEFLTVLNGENGKILNEARWPSAISENYNSNSRNYLAIAHLDGINPSVIAGRGTYYAQKLVSFDKHLNIEWERELGIDIVKKFNNQYLRKLWKLISDDQSRASHSLPIADVDENGTEEILWGEHCITSDGDDLWEIEDKMPYWGHPDIVYAADIIPESPGKEVYYCREGWNSKEDNIGMLLVDKMGKKIWGKWGFTHIDGGWAAKTIPGNDEWQLFGFDVESKDWKPGEHKYLNPSTHLFDPEGNLVMHPDSAWIGSFTVDWEGDGIREICTKKGEILRYNNDVIAEFGNGVYWGGDIIGDHREELIVAPNNGIVYIILNSTKLKVDPEITKLADRQYRNDLSRTGMQINVIPTQSGYIYK